MIIIDNHLGVCCVCVCLVVGSQLHGEVATGRCGGITSH